MEKRQMAIKNHGSCDGKGYKSASFLGKTQK
jgi:hypothetical protein